MDTEITYLFLKYWLLILAFDVEKLNCHSWQGFWPLTYSLLCVTIILSQIVTHSLYWLRLVCSTALLNRACSIDRADSWKLSVISFTAWDCCFYSLRELLLWVRRIFDLLCLVLILELRCFQSVSPSFRPHSFQMWGLCKLRLSFCTLSSPAFYFDVWPHDENWTFDSNAYLRQVHNPWPCFIPFKLSKDILEAGPIIIMPLPLHL